MLSGDVMFVWASSLEQNLQNLHPNKRDFFAKVDRVIERFAEVSQVHQESRSCTHSSYSLIIQ